MQSPLYFDCCRRSYRLGADSFPTIRYNESLLSDVIDSDLFIGAASLAQRVTTLWIIKRKPRGKDNGTLQNRNQKRQAWIFPFVFFFLSFFFLLISNQSDHKNRIGISRIISITIVSLYYKWGALAPAAGKELNRRMLPKCRRFKVRNKLRNIELEDILCFALVYSRNRIDWDSVWKKKRTGKRKMKRERKKERKIRRPVMDRFDGFIAPYKLYLRKKEHCKMAAAWKRE